MNQNKENMNYFNIANDISNNFSKVIYPKRERAFGNALIIQDNIQTNETNKMGSMNKIFVLHNGSFQNSNLVDVPIEKEMHVIQPNVKLIILNLEFYEWSAK